MGLKKRRISNSSLKIRVGITIGDPSGIGPAITLKAINKLKGLADFVIIGDEWVLNRTTYHIPYTRSIKIVDLQNVIRKNFSFGKIKPEYGRASIEYLDKAIELIKDKKIDCLVTSPISKEAINLAHFKYPGHTEYLAQKTHTKDFVMLLLNKGLKIALLTRHTPLKKVASMLNRQLIYKNIFLMHRSLKQLFLIKKPRIIVCGLNPHASDNGLIGSEERMIIEPALRTLRKKYKLHIDGPISSDVAIYRANSKFYHAVVALYHDQALIPLKLLGPDTGVNMTLGLPFIRTSPLHGTAFDIAKEADAANPNSMLEAISTAIKCTKNLRKA